MRLKHVYVHLRSHGQSAFQKGGKSKKKEKSRAERMGQKLEFFSLLTEGKDKNKREKEGPWGTEPATHAITLFSFKTLNNLKRKHRRMCVCVRVRVGFRVGKGSLAQVGKLKAGEKEGTKSHGGAISSRLPILD